MNIDYPATYVDGRGEVRTVMHNDGHELCLTVRGVSFVGTDFDDLKPQDQELDLKELPFTLTPGGELCQCQIGLDMPVELADGELLEQGILHVWLELGRAREDGGLDKESVTIRLGHHGRVYSSGLSEGWFEVALDKLGASLPEGVYIKSCVNCAYSDYHPAGSPMFGGLACFRDVKVEYGLINGKAGLMDLWGHKTQLVQETHVCPQFERRKAGTGYRG